MTGLVGWWRRVERDGVNEGMEIRKQTWRNLEPFTWRNLETTGEKRDPYTQTDCKPGKCF